jgi:predicted nucleotidyltransferase
MIGKEKVAYTPSQNKFFEISKDPISQERKKVLMECFRDLNKLFPGLDIGFSLFGSLSKGKLLDTPGIAESSDIDLLVLFSKEKLQALFKSGGNALLKMISQIEPDPDSTNASEEDEILFLFEKYLRVYINNELKTNINCHYVQETGVMALGMSDDSFSKKLEEFNLSPQLVVIFFGYDLGYGLRKWQVKFLEYVKKQDEVVKNLFWDRIKQACLEFLRNGDLPEKVLKEVPETFEAACRLYGVKI